MPWVCPQKVKNFKANKLQTVIHGHKSRKTTQKLRKKNKPRTDRAGKKTVTDEEKMEFCLACNYRIYWMETVNDVTL